MPGDLCPAGDEHGPHGVLRSLSLSRAVVRGQCVGFNLSGNVTTLSTLPWRQFCVVSNFFFLSLFVRVCVRHPASGFGGFLLVCVPLCL